MDLKLKSKSWSRSIYHQFESICQDVDDFVKKDTVKYVENQVQNVGVSVKRFYNVVQEVFPHPGDDVKPKAQSLAEKQVDMKEHVSSVTAIVENPTCVDEKQMSVEQGSIGTARSSSGSLLVEVDHGLLFTKGPCADHSQETKNYLYLSEDVDAIIPNGADNCFEENSTRDSISLTTDSSSENQIFPVASDEDHKTSSPALSANEAGLLAIKEENTSRFCFSNDADSVSDISSSGWSFRDDLLTVEDPIFNENKSLSVPSVSLFDNVDEDESLLMDSPLTLILDTYPRVLGEDEILSDKIPTFADPDSNENRSSSGPSDKIQEDNSLSMDLPPFSALDVVQTRALEEDGARCGSLSTKDDVSTPVQSPERAFSCFSCDDEKEETGVRTSSFSTFPESSNIMESTSVDFTHKAACNSHTHSNGCVYDISTLCTPTMTYETKSVDMIPAFSILESNGDNASSIERSVAVVDSSESSREQNNKDALSNFAISPDTGRTHEFGDSIVDVNMETIDLSSNVNHEEGNVIFNGNFGYAASHRRRNFRYYKKLIQEAFASRKRLSKEYEHLAIMYGDIDKESRHHFEPSSLPSSPISIHAAKTRLCETEWELL